MNKITFALNGGARVKIGQFRRTFLLEVLILKKNMQLPQTLRVRRSNLNVPTELKRYRKGTRLRSPSMGDQERKLVDSGRGSYWRS